jgi:hypothetical protein
MTRRLTGRGSRAARERRVSSAPVEMTAASIAAATMASAQ